MKKYFFTLLAVCMIAGNAGAESVGPSKTFMAVSELRKESADNNNVFDLAEREAAEFTFSDGTVRGEQLNRALKLIRRERPRLQATDMNLAIAILQAN